MSKEKKSEEISVTKPPKICNICHKGRVVPIIYGLPSNELERKYMTTPSSKLEFILGGCEVTDNDPKWECLECEVKYFQRQG